MEQRQKVTFMRQEFENSETGEKVPGVTVIVDGVFRQVCDKLIAETDREQDYVKLIQDALFRGINEMLRDAEKEQK